MSNKLLDNYNCNYNYVYDYNRRMCAWTFVCIWKKVCPASFVFIQNNLQYLVGCWVHPKKPSERKICLSLAMRIPAGNIRTNSVAVVLSKLTLPIHPILDLLLQFDQQFCCCSHSQITQNPIGQTPRQNLKTRSWLKIIWTVKMNQLHKKAWPISN